MNIDGMTLCEREARGERAQSRRSARTAAADAIIIAVEQKGQICAPQARGQRKASATHILPVQETLSHSDAPLSP